MAVFKSVHCDLRVFLLRTGLSLDAIGGLNLGSFVLGDCGLCLFGSESVFPLAGGCVVAEEKRSSCTEE